MKQIVKLLRSISDLVNRLPFSGKLAIKPVLWSAFTATKNKRKKSLGAYLLLLLMILGHAYQAKLGYSLVVADLGLIATMVGFLYGLVNLFVTYTQIFLAIRLSSHLYKYYIKERISSVSAKPYKEFSVLHTTYCICTTLGGQIIFSFFSLSL